jgi:hypothetical protein
MDLIISDLESSELSKLREIYNKAIKEKADFTKTSLKNLKRKVQEGNDDKS